MIRTKNRSSHPQDPALERGIDHHEVIVAEEEVEEVGSKAGNPPECRMGAMAPEAVLRILGGRMILEVDPEREMEMDGNLVVEMIMDLDHDPGVPLGGKGRDYLPLLLDVDRQAHHPQGVDLPLPGEGIGSETIPHRVEGRGMTHPLLGEGNRLADSEIERTIPLLDSVVHHPHHELDGVGRTIPHHDALRLLLPNALERERDLPLPAPG
jgi:hypothetical protein